MSICGIPEREDEGTDEAFSPPIEIDPPAVLTCHHVGQKGGPETAMARGSDLGTSLLARDEHEITIDDLPLQRHASASG